MTKSERIQATATIAAGIITNRGMENEGGASEIAILAEQVVYEIENQHPYIETEGQACLPKESGEIHRADG